jgi:hypothetical protein
MGKLVDVKVADNMPVSDALDIYGASGVVVRESVLAAGADTHDSET